MDYRGRGLIRRAGRGAWRVRWGWRCGSARIWRRSTRPGEGDELYGRGLALAVREQSNPLMFEISLARGFKLAAWARPDLAVDGRALALLAGGLRLWYSRVCLIHAVGIRLAPRIWAAGDGRGRAAGG